MGGKKMQKNNQATIGLPVYLIIAIITSSTVLATLSFAMYNLLSDSLVYDIEKEINKIVSQAENMFEYADSGSIETVSVEFPENIKFIVFGGLPINYTNITQNILLDENTSNNYFFILNNERIYTYHSTVRFSGFNINNVALFQPGKYDLRLELVKYNGKSYIKIY